MVIACWPREPDQARGNAIRATKIDAAHLREEFMCPDYTFAEIADFAFLNPEGTGRGMKDPASRRGMRGRKKHREDQEAYIGQEPRGDVKPVLLSQ